MGRKALAVALGSLSLAVSAGAAGVGSDAAFSASLGAAREALLSSFHAAARAGLKARQGEDDLLVLLDSQDINVRLQAVHDLKAYAAGSEKTRGRLLQVLQDAEENVLVRREAARALSAGAADESVRSALLEEAQNQSEPYLVRAMSAMALYGQAATLPDVRDALVSAAKEESDLTVRRAAIWALFASVGTPDVREALLDLAQNDFNTDMRVEALKSLWGAMNLPEVGDLAGQYAKAQDITVPEPVRLAAILMLSQRFSDDQTQLLDSIAANDFDPAARQAAALALGGPDSDEIVRYFHSFHYVWRDGIRYAVNDPIDEE